MKDIKIEFDFYKYGKGYKIVMQDFGGTDSIKIESKVTMDYIGFSDTAVGKSEKLFVFIDNINNVTSFKDFFGLLSYYEFKSRAELDNFVNKFPMQIQDAIKKELEL